MAENTAISWADRTWSPWYGCTQISMGEHGACVACYARQISETRMGRVVFGGPGRGEGTRDPKAESGWREPLRWERDAAMSARMWAKDMTGPWPYSPFVFPSMCDPWDNHRAVGPSRIRFITLMDETPHLTWLPLTKRPGNIIPLFYEAMVKRGHSGDLSLLWPRNAAIGFTAVTQEEFDRDWPKARAAFRTMDAPFVFWSGEPLFSNIMLPDDFLELGQRAWAITGGETDQGKHRARPTNPNWERSIRDQCAAAGVPYHRKQAGEFIEAYGDYRGELIRQRVTAEETSDHLIMFKVGKKAAGRALDGVIHDARPIPRAA